MDYKKAIEISLGAKDSELYKFEYTIPDGYEAEIKDGKVIVKKKDSDDEMIIKGLENFLWCIANGGMNDRGTMPSAEKCQEWLAYLEKQKEQQPAEWSEEDEKMLVGIIERGSAQIPPHEPALREEQMEWLMNRLKSIRPQPHWKPSEEQMRCLLDCVSKAKEIHNASVGGYDAYRILVSLYDELNKLL